MSDSSLQTACPKCGKALPTDAVYCPACGQKRDKGAAASSYTPREKVGLALFGLVVLYCYYLIAETIAHRMKLQSTWISGTFFFTGLFASGIARKRRVLFFFVGCFAAVPLMFLAGMLGGVMRAP